MLLYDLLATQPIGNIKRHGGGVYAEKVFFNLSEKSSDFSCFYDSRLWINPEIKKKCDELKITMHDIANEDFKSIVSMYSLLYSALPNESTKQAKIKKIFTVHGLRLLETPIDSYRYKYGKSCIYKFKELIKTILAKNLKKKEHQHFVKSFLWDSDNVELITVSNHSRVSLELLIPEIIRKNVPLHTFYAPNTIDTCLPFRKEDTPKYLLMVSANRWVKNCLRACVAFDELVSDGYFRNVKMKIAGAEKNSFDYTFKNPQVFDFLGYVSDDELNKLYQNTYMFVYPSLNEGFGYPPLEAMANHVPVISSCFASIPEVCGDAVMYFNPFSIIEIKNRMIQMDNPLLREQFIIKGLSQFKHIKEKQDIDLNHMTDYLLSK